MTVLTVTAPPQTGQATLVTDEVAWRISVAQYHQMIKSGVLTDNEIGQILVNEVLPPQLANQEEG